MADEALHFLPATAVDWSTILANVALFVGALYAGFKAIPGLAAALKNLARRDASRIASDQTQDVRQSAASDVESGSLDALKERRVAAVFALFEEWRRSPGVKFVPFDHAIIRMLGFFDLMLVDLPTDRADHWRQVIVGELVKHTEVFSKQFGGVGRAKLDQFSPALRELINEAINIA